VECVEGFEFTDTPVIHTQPCDSGDAVTLGKIGNKFQVLHTDCVQQYVVKMFSFINLLIGIKCT
jgi:hypothetical protein